MSDPIPLMAQVNATYGSSLGFLERFTSYNPATEALTTNLQIISRVTLLWERVKAFFGLATELDLTKYDAQGVILSLQTVLENFQASPASSSLTEEQRATLFKVKAVLKKLQQKLGKKVIEGQEYVVDPSRGSRDRQTQKRILGFDCLEGVITTVDQIVGLNSHLLDHLS